MISSFTLCNSRTTSSKISCRTRPTYNVNSFSNASWVCTIPAWFVQHWLVYWSCLTKQVRHWRAAASLPTCFILSNSVSASLVLPMGLTLKNENELVTDYNKRWVILLQVSIIYSISKCCWLLIKNLALVEKNEATEKYFCGSDSASCIIISFPLPILIPVKHMMWFIPKSLQ